MDEAGPADNGRLGAGRPASRAASAARFATPREWPAVCGAFTSTRSAIASRTSSSSAPLTIRERRGSASRTRSQLDASPRPSRSSSALRQNASTSAGSSCLPALLARELAGGASPAEPVVDLGRRGQRDQARRQRDRIPFEPVRLDPCRPSARRSLERNAGRRVEPDPAAGNCRRQRRVGEQECADLLHPTHGERRDHPRARETTVSRADQAQHPGYRLDPALEAVRLESDVVAEPLRLLVRVRVAVDMPEQPRVVGRNDVRLACPDPVGETQCDHGLLEGVLHRLAQTQVGGQRQGRHQLGQTNRRGGADRHRGTLAPARPAETRSRWPAGEPCEEHAGAPAATRSVPGRRTRPGTRSARRRPLAAPFPRRGAVLGEPLR